MSCTRAWPRHGDGVSCIDGSLLTHRSSTRVGNDYSRFRQCNTCKRTYLCTARRETCRLAAAWWPFCKPRPRMHIRSFCFKYLAVRRNYLIDPRPGKGTALTTSRALRSQHEVRPVVSSRGRGASSSVLTESCKSLANMADTRAATRNVLWVHED